MSFVDKLFSFEGRIGRGDWWLLNVLILVVSMVGWFIGFSLMGGPPPPPAGVDELGKPLVAFDGGPDLGTLLLVLLAPAVVTLWPSLAVQVKRWHDRDKGAVWLLINFIPYVGPLWATVELGFLAGTPGGNRFGPGPGRGADSVADVFGDEDEGYAEAAIARWQAEQTRAAPQATAWNSPPAATGGGFGRRGLSPAR